jgi:hypothetical protein
MPALIAASTPNGEFSTTIASEGLMFVICNAIWNGLGSGFHYPTSSPVTIISKFFKPMFSSSVVSISCLAEPLATAFKHLQLSNHYQFSCSLDRLFLNFFEYCLLSFANFFYEVIIYTFINIFPFENLFYSLAPGIPSSK